jgi:predicted transcriptional regulator
MADLKLDVHATDKVQVDSETLTAINRGIRAVDQGQTVSLEEAEKIIPVWIADFESRHPR